MVDARTVAVRVVFGSAEPLRDLGEVRRVRGWTPDVVLLVDGPRRVRWRTRGAALADRLGLVVAGGGEPAVGNLVLVNVRLAAHDWWPVRTPLTPGRLMRGAALARVSAGGVRFVVGAGRLSSHTDDRERQAQALARALAPDQPTAARSVGADPVVLGLALDAPVRSVLPLVDAQPDAPLGTVLASPSVQVQQCRAEGPWTVADLRLSDK